jgi:hypothetical protein
MRAQRGHAAHDVTFSALPCRCNVYPNEAAGCQSCSQPWVAVVPFRSLASTYEALVANANRCMHASVDVLA